MRTINILCIIFIFVFILSCDDLLNETVRSDVSFQHYDTREGVEHAVGAVYESLRDQYRIERLMSFHQHGTDIWQQARDTAARTEVDAYLNLTPSYPYLHSDIWIPYYTGVARANTAIDAIENIGDKMSESQKSLRLAEVKFLRAFYYFTLVRQFGSIPLVTTPSLSANTDFPSSSVADVYDQIISDLTSAQENLPLTQNDYGRATKGAAQHLLAKVYLTRGSAVTDQRGQQPDDMAKAAEFADRVISSGVYELEPDFARIWDYDNMLNNEIIFAVQFHSNNLYNNNSSNRHHMYTIGVYDLKPGMQRTVEYGRPINRNAPTQYHITELHDPTIDSRFHKTFQSVWLSNNPNNIPVWQAAGGFEPAPELLGQPKFAVGDTAVWITNEILPESTNFDSLYASKPYYYMPINRMGPADFFALEKHKDDPGRRSISDSHGTRDQFLYRLASTYLIAAEAYGRMGDFATAADRLNEVRRRAAYKAGEVKPPEFWHVYGGNYADRDKSTVQEMLLTAQDLQSMPSFVDFMLDELARELAGEMKRWHDLVRTEKLVERAQHSPFAAPNVQEHHRLRPIPQEHIDRLDPLPPIAEVQNEGYY